MQNNLLRFGDRNFIAKLTSTNATTLADKFRLGRILHEHGARYFTRNNERDGYRVKRVVVECTRMDIEGVFGLDAVRVGFTLEEVK